jgi:glycosyltransferase involved in cell wall biosynthesis
MNILLALFFPRTLSHEGGQAQLESLATAFSTLGHDITILAPFNGDTDKYTVIKPEIKGRINIFTYMRILHNISPNYDLVWLLENNPTVSFIAKSAKSDNNNLIVSFGSPYQEFSRIFTTTLSFQYLYHYVMKNKFWTNFQTYDADHYVISTDFQKKQLEKLGISETKLHVIPYGVPIDKGLLKSREETRDYFEFGDHKVVSYLGHFSPIKGVPILIKAFNQAAERNKDLMLAIAHSGKGLESKKVYKLINAIKHKDRVRLFGIVNPYDFLGASDLTVLPFLSNSIPHYPLVLLEALASEVPVITTDVGGLRELIITGETGMLVSPNDVGSLSHAITDLLADRDQFGRIIKNIRSINHSKLNCQRTAKRILEIVK